MKSTILLITTALALNATAQQTSRVYSVTDQNKGGYNWSAIRSATAASAQQLILNNFSARGTVIDAALQQKKATYAPNEGNFNDQPMFSGVAALAYDKDHDRLYFATMFTQQLRYINLNSKQPDHYYQAGDISLLTKNKTALTPETQGPVITRMTIGADGYGYGISNDGETFFRFSLDNKTKLESLGSLLDDEKNGSVSVHNACSSWGGDMVASAQGDLYLFTMRQLVFRVDPKTRIATYLGKISGLDNNFTVNGAAVDEKGKVVLSTASFAGSRAIIDDIKTLAAVQEKGDEFFNASDLASSNLLFSSESIKQTDLTITSKPDIAISMFPNPANDGFTVIRFEKNVTGKVTIDLLSGSGTNMLRQPVQIMAEGQQVRLNTRRLAKGLYVVRVTDSEKKDVYVSKLMVQ